MSARAVLVTGAGFGSGPRTLVGTDARTILAMKALLPARRLDAVWGHGIANKSKRRSRTIKTLAYVLIAGASASCLLLSPAAHADSPARERQLTCSDGTVFNGEQVRHGNGRPPSVWRGVTPAADRVAFVFRAVAVTAPDGLVDAAETWDNTAGVALHHQLTTCSFVIPVGPLTGYRADFIGFFVPNLR